MGTGPFPSCTQSGGTNHRKHRSNNASNRNTGGIDGQGVPCWAERSDFSRCIPLVARLDLAQKGGKGNIQPLILQLLIAPFRPFLGACGKEYLEGRVREYDRTHVAPVRHQPRRAPEASLLVQQGRPHTGNCGNGRGRRSGRFRAQFVGGIVAVDDDPGFAAVPRIAEADLGGFGTAGDRRRIREVQTGGTRRTVERGVEALREMAEVANAYTRTRIPASELVIGMQCGGSDGYSGITANPALGVASDLLVAHGGTTILSETTEVYGAEHLLTRRAVSAEVGQKLVDRIRWWEDYCARNKGEMNNNPSPGNKRGGLTTILEKSLGAVAKGGTAPMQDVYLFAEQITKKGFVFMDSPGYDPCSVTGQIASGANLIVFTTGRGSVSGYKPVPCIKVATNSEMYRHMTEDMDLNTGDIIDEGISLADKGRELFELFLRVASGQATKSEELGFGGAEFVPWQIGAVM